MKRESIFFSFLAQELQWWTKMTVTVDQDTQAMYPSQVNSSGIKIADGLDLTMIQVDLIQMDDKPADSCTISLMALLF